MTHLVARLRGRPFVAARWPELLSASVAWASARYTAGPALGLGFPLDDAWIHMVYGLAVVREGSLAYNDGVPATGCTSPLWALAAALAHGVAWTRAPSMAAALVLKHLGMLLHAGTSALAARLARSETRQALGPAPALAAGLLVATCPVLAYGAASGMEVPLAAALMLGALLCSSRGSALAAGACAAAAFLARPEALVVAAPALGLLCVRAPTPAGEGTARRLRATLLAALLPIFAAIAGLVTRDELASGRPLPATFYAKAAVVRDSIVAQIRVEAAWDLLRSLLPFAPLLRVALIGALLAAPAAWMLGRGRRPSAAALAATAAAGSGLSYVLVVAFMVRIQAPSAFYFQRYFAPALPSCFFAAAVAMAHGGASLLAIARRSIAVPRLGLLACYGLLVAAACAVQVRHLPAERDRYESDVESIDAVQVAEGRYLASAVPADAVVWAMDAGAPRYWGRHRTVDLGRLNTPELFERDAVRPGWDASAVAVLDGPVRVTSLDGSLEFLAGFPSRADGPVPGTPAGAVPGLRFTQVLWRCRAAGDIRIDGYPTPLRGRCRG